MPPRTATACAGERGDVHVAQAAARSGNGNRVVDGDDRTVGPRYGRCGMVIEGPAVVLHDRRVEREALERLLAAVRGGESRGLVVSGDPGDGKTALLESAISPAPGFRVMRAVGVESEMELAFAALQQWRAPVLDRLDRLPGPQGDALGVAFGLRAGDAPDRFLVGLAVLSLLAEMSEERPLVCVVDDAQWLDRASAQALVFVARRLLAEPIALVLVTRGPGEERTAFQELVIEGLRDGDARALLSSAVGVPLDERVQERIVAETRGNPLALLELPRGLTPAQLAGGFGLPGAMGLSRRIEESFRRRLATLPKDTRRFLVVAAADPVGDPVLVWRAAKRLGVGPEAANAAEADGLLSIGGTVRFRHPLVRSTCFAARGQHGGQHAVARTAPIARSRDGAGERDRPLTLAVVGERVDVVVGRDTVESPSNLATSARRVAARGARRGRRGRRRRGEFPPGPPDGAAEAVAGEPQPLDRINLRSQLLPHVGVRAPACCRFRRPAVNRALTSRRAQPGCQSRRFSFGGHKGPSPPLDVSSGTT